MLIKAITLDKNEVYYRNLSQVYISRINLLVNDKEVSEDTLKSELQQPIYQNRGESLNRIPLI